MIKKLKVAPLSSSFLFTSIIGFVISAMYVYKLDKPFGFTFMILFGIMFIAAMISMTKAPVEAEIAMDHHVKESGKKPSKHH